MLTLKIKTDNPYLAKLYSNHKHAYLGDARIDLYASSDIIMLPNALSVEIPLSIQLELVNINNESLSYFIISRSSIYKTPIRLTQSILVTDSGFRGKLALYVDNLSDQTYHIKKGERYFQVISSSLNSITTQLVDNLSEGSRGDKGLGSSGISKL